MRYILKQKTQLNRNAAAMDALQKELGISKVMAGLLCARGILNVADAHRFLNPDISQLCDPFLFRDMHDAVSMVKHMLATKAKICIYGDYDADGTSACAIMSRALKAMGGSPKIFLPSRMEHGYGLSVENVEALQGTDLLITVDCGITNTAEIARAHALGMKTIITDHHECPPVLPKADFILNPKREGETYPFLNLCGAGVAFQFARALLGDAALQWIDIAALATIADIVPLQGENRIIAAAGLKKMNENPNAGIAALAKKACPKRQELDAQSVSFTLAPRINAAGRISTARIAFDLLSEDDDKKLDQLSDQLCKLNLDRQDRQEKVVKEALQMAAESEYDRAIVLANSEWDIGIVGLAASKIAEKYTRPTVLLGQSEQEGVYTGSARSIDGVNIYEALHVQSHLYEKFGGHAGAAGLTLKKENIDVLRKRLNSFLREKYSDDIFRPVKYFDMQIKIPEISEKMINELDLLKPFGHKNEPVEFLIKNSSVTDIRPIGDDKHAKFNLLDKNKILNAVAFGIQAQTIPQRADIVGTLSINSYDGKPQMVVNTFSYEESQTVQYERAQTYLLQSEKNEIMPGEKDRYFVTREGLLELFVILRGISEKGTVFSDMGAIVLFLRKYLPDMDAGKMAFAFLVLQQIGLLEVKKNDRIHIVIKNGKRDLNDSGLYRRFL
ncbi:MAG: single-stranded-DNA-specific exonuclease RecJ [Christensenella sp.]|nr:single-stranded-DNA-specific exonuclease RecJ [Christensenella sp.]